MVILQSLNRQEYLRNPELLRTLEEKMPSVMKFMWSDFISNLEKPSFEVSLEDFGNWISRKASAMSRNISFEKCKSQKNNKEKEEIIAVANSSNEVRKQELKCPVCQQAHSIQNCKTFLDKEVTKRYQIANEERLCFSCLSSAHPIYKCKSRRICNTNGCIKKHHPLLHLEAPKKIEMISHISNSKKTLLRIIPVTLQGPSGEISTFALLDSASTASIIHNSIAEELGLVGKNEPLCLQWANGEQVNEKDSRKVSVQISGKNEMKSFTLKNLRTVNELPLLMQTVDKEELKKKWSYLKDIKFESFKDARPTIIIGEDNNLLMVTRNVIHGGWNSPVATKTWLGWAISGNTENKDEGTVFAYHICDSAFKEITEEVKETFLNQDFGVEIIDENSTIIEDKEVEEITYTTSKIIDEKRKFGLVWRNDLIQLPESILAKKDELKRKITNHHDIIFDKEVKVKKIHFVQGKQMMELSESSKYSKWTKLIRSTVWMFCFIRKMFMKNNPEGHKMKIMHKNKIEDGKLSLIEMKAADLRKVQEESFKVDLKSINQKINVEVTLRVKWKLWDPGRDGLSCV